MITGKTVPAASLFDNWRIGSHTCIANHDFWIENPLYNGLQSEILGVPGFLNCNNR